MATWPPVLADLKLDKGLEAEDVRDDTVYQSMLDAAVEFVEGAREGDFDFEDDPLSELPEPTTTLCLGTIRLAVRWYDRRKSPDGGVVMGDMGTSYIPSIDPDISRMLGIGRYAPPRFA